MGVNTLAALPRARRVTNRQLQRLDDVAERRQRLASL
jgi:hypothetical protein